MKTKSKNCFRNLMKRGLPLFNIIIILCLLVACTTNFEYTFNVSTGDKIKVELDTTIGYKLKQEDGTFSVLKDNSIITSGKFFTAEETQSYFNKVPTSEGVTLIDSGTYQNNKYILYLYDNTWYYVIKVEGSSTGIGLVNTISEESAKKCFELFQFEIE